MECDGEGTDLATLESSASCSAASPYTFSPRLSLSISNPPSYRPMSNVCCEDADGAGAGAGAAAAFVGDGGLVLDFVGIDDEELDFCTAGAGNGLGAANLDNSFETFCPLWLGFFWCVAPAGLVVFGFDDISSAAICLVTAPIEVIVVCGGCAVMRGR